MENWTQRILLICRPVVILASLLVMSSAVLSDDSQRPLIEPDVKPIPVDESLLDDENFEVGAFFGVISIEDFESSTLYGARVTYHLSEDLFIEGSYGLATAGTSTWERLSNTVFFDEDDARDYSYYSANVGYNIFPGEVFFGRNYAMNTNFYLVAGAGATEFGGDNRFTINYGAGFQVLWTDWLAMHFTAREHVYEITLAEEEKTSFNTELSFGLSVFF